ncbi:MAG TPA: hypothetical protein VF581_08815 [Flavobacterium sp.]|jgi:hypothetical protein
MKKYFPILLSKPGELSALAKLSSTAKNEISPILQVLSGTVEKIEAFSSEWDFDGNELFLDFSVMDPFVRATVLNIITHLTSNGVNVVPVVQENSNPRYLALVADLVTKGEIERACIRFSNGSGGFLNLNLTIAALLGSLAVRPQQVTILIDFGLIGSTNYNMTATIASTIINSITDRADYDNIIVSSGSFPNNLGALSPAGRVYRLPRYEWNVWLVLQSQPKIRGTIKYSDYGTKYPFYSEANFQGSCSIKYTTTNDYVIYRGEISGNHRDGNGQYITFAKRLIASADYSGSTFSWGDERIEFFSTQSIADLKRKTGNAGSWVEISQNHHMTYLVSLL